MKALESNLKKLLLLRAIHMGILIMPVIVVLWRSVGLSLADIFILQVVFSVTMFVLEVPSGYLADWLGRRRLLIAAYLILTLGFFTFAIAESFWVFVVGEIILGVGVGCVSGTDMSLLYDTLAGLGREREFSHYQGRLLFYSQLSEAGAAIIGGLLGAVDLRLPFYIYTVQILMAAVLATRLVEPKRKKFSRDSHHKENAMRVFRHIRETPQLANYIGFASVLAAGTLTAVWLYQEFWITLEVPLKWFGPLWASINVIVAVTARTASAVRERLGTQLTLTIVSVLPAVGFLGMGLIPGYAAIACAAFIQVSRGFVSVLVTDEINKLTGSEMRATVNSIASGSVRVVFCVAGLTVGFVADRFGMSTAFLLCAFVFGFGGVGMLLKVRTGGGLSGTIPSPVRSDM